MAFQPKYTLSIEIADALVRFEALKTLSPPLIPLICPSPPLKGEEQALKGYRIALGRIEKWVENRIAVTEELIQTIHALVMGEGKVEVEPTAYRDGQNIIKGDEIRPILYIPPKANDIAPLMKALVDWIGLHQTLPSLLLAGICHYQLATIHPYYDGNGRTARILTTLILRLGGYDLQRLYTFEAQYAGNQKTYYDALDIGPSHNYYKGRAEADITGWLNYFIGFFK